MKPIQIPVASVSNKSLPEEKIRLFRSLFRGREDVYPRRFENRKANRSGYAPACANEWVRGVCEKPRIKCTECPHRKFLQVTDKVIGWHLSGQDDQEADFVMGLYPMLLDETCFFLAADFDNKDWQSDVAGFLATAQTLNVPAVLERSRSGQGGHIWIFFDQAIPATQARKLGFHILTETMDRRPDIGFGSYDRFFPNQDTLPRGGFGNLIALPLQKKARNQENSVFLNEQFLPHSDQWAFLSSIRRMTRMDVEALVREAESKGRIIGVRVAALDEDDDTPWSAPPSRRRRVVPITGNLPENVELVLGDQIYISKEPLGPALINRLVSLAAFQNPEFYRAQAMRLSTYNKPRIINCAEEHPLHLALPRGCLEEILELLKELKIKPILRDERSPGIELKVLFSGTLRPDQELAATALSKHDIGVLAATTAFGKTVLASWLIAHRRVNTLVLVHRQQLLDQWVERLSSFLNLPANEIGRLGGGRKKLNGFLDVALVQSLVHKGIVDDRVGNYGHLIVDECHHVSSRSFELVTRRAKARYVVGLSATVTRKDGHHPIMFMQCGPIRYRVDAKKQALARPFNHYIIVRPTGFRSLKPPNDDIRVQFHELYEALINDAPRTQMICEDVINAVKEGRSPLVLTERINHLDAMAALLCPEVSHLILLQGGQSRKEIELARQRLTQVPTSQSRVILATGKYIGEGFDDSRLDTLFLALPISWRGTVAQYVGRLHRLHDGKREVRVYDYADLDIPMLSRMFDKRCRGYESLGYTVLLPASALPNWPSEVPLPVDPEWKRDYAASVRRLIRDGVDVHLGNLFLQTTRVPNLESEGESRARSASEAFLYRRLKTLPETEDRFRLNVELPIAFQGAGKMEVDLVDEGSKLVIELDGGQHFANREAYRRDRQKDALLQREGYYVLRFLVEDVGSQLDLVLDSILAALDHLTRISPHKCKAE